MDRHPQDLATVRDSYDRVADNYARMVATEGLGDIRRQPWLRATVDVFADLASRRDHCWTSGAARAP